MKRILLTALLTLVLVTPGLGGIRGTEWGMSKAEVKRLEGKPKEETEDRLIYEDRLSGLKTAVVYLFNHRQELYSITYDFEMDKRERSFFNRALQQFDKIGRILREKYGPPVRGEIYSDREKKIGTLLLKKPVIEGWQIDKETYVDHTLEYEDVYNHALIYGHQGLTDEYEGSHKQKELEKF